MADDLGWEPIAGVAGASGSPHRTRLPIPVRPRKPGRPANLTVPSLDNYSTKDLRYGFPATPVWAKYASVSPLFLEDERARIIVRVPTSDPGGLAGFTEQK